MKQNHILSIVVAFIVSMFIASGCSTSPSKNGNSVQSNGLQPKKMYCTSETQLVIDNDNKERKVRDMMRDTKARVFRVKGAMCLDVVLVYIQKDDILKGDKTITNKGRNILNKLSYALHTHDNTTMSRIAVHAHTGNSDSYSSTVKRSSKWGSHVTSALENALQTKADIPFRGFGKAHMVVPRAVVGDGIGDRDMNDRIEILITSESFTGPMNLSVSELVGYTDENTRHRHY